LFLKAVRPKGLEAKRRTALLVVTESKILNLCAPEGTRTPIGGTGNHNSIH
jgi:hypothetical protein